MTGLLLLLRDHPDAVEADLSRYHQIDLVDLWRRPKRLTYRQVLVRARHLPADSATATALRGRPAWTTALQIADVTRMGVLAIAGVKDIGPHPESPYQLKAKPGAADAAREAAIRRAQQRNADLGRPPRRET